MNPNAPDSSPGNAEAAIREAAARWTVRQDRRLSPPEAAEFKAWLAADPRHGEALAEAGASWKKFRQLGSLVRREPEQSGATPARAWWGVGGLAAAAAIAVVIATGVGRKPDSGSVAPIPTAVASVTRTLPDGSTAQFRADAEIVEVFSTAERRVRQVRGEVYFTVAKDAARPFYVEVGGVSVRAVGTAFAVKFDARAVDVLVTEGTVQVAPHAPAAPTEKNPAPAHGGPAMVSAGYRASVARIPGSAPGAVVVQTVSPIDMARALTWSDAMLDLGGASLGELAALFEQKNGRKIVVSDSALAQVKIGGRYPLGDVDGFVRALEEIYDVKAERGADGSIRLSRSR